MADKTVFEKIVDRELPAWIIYEDEKNIAFLSIAPFEKGHVVLIPKKPYVTIWEMSEDEYLALQALAYRIAKHLHQKLNCGVNVFQNNLPIAEQTIPHVHINIAPRLSNKHLYQQDNTETYSSKEEADQFHELLKMM